MNLILILAFYVTISGSLMFGWSIMPGFNTVSGATQTGCTPLGNICVPRFGTHSLPTGKWFGEVNGVPAFVLALFSIDKSGKFDGTMTGGNSTCKTNPCRVDGYFDNETGRISFTVTSRPKPPAAITVPTVQNYTGL